VNRSAKGSLAELHTVAAQTAAGMICGRAYDDHGVPIASDLDTRILAISFVDFCALPSRWVIGIGQSKGRRSAGQLSLEVDRTGTASRPSGEEPLLTALERAIHSGNRSSKSCPALSSA
jgi:Putative sugar-binding domain